MAFDRVLLAVGPADEGNVDGILEATVDLVSGTDATVYVLYTFGTDDYESILNAMEVDATTDELPPDEVARRHELVRTLTERLEAEGIDCRVRATVGGTPAEQILDRIDRFGADVAVVTGRRRSPAGKAMFGDRAQRVLLNAPCPVVYLKAAES